MIKIYVDKRELRSPVAKELELLNCDVEYVIAEVGDYILSGRVGCERKTSEDFFNSLFGDKKLFGQLFDLKNAYEVPLLLFEGYEQELWTTRNVNPKAIQGILNAIALMRIPIIYTLNVKGTAEIIKSIATKEQTEDTKSFSPHGKRSHLSQNAQLEYIVSAAPGIGRGTAILLLNEFKTIEGIATASIGDIQKIKGIDKTANNIREVMSRKYNGEKI